MLGLFRRGRTDQGPDHSGLGGAMVCVPADTGAQVPAGCVGLLFDARGNVRRVPAGQRLQLAQGEEGRIFHPGPYSFDVTACATAPEVGLRFALAVDGPDPRVMQQRFDLFLASEAPPDLHLDMLQAAVETAVQRELAQGRLFLPPCTTLNEWNAFRQGVNELVYTRFGIMVDDCVPVDLGGRVDFAAMLDARAGEQAAQPASVDWARRAARALRPPGAAGADLAAADARALRRLFLELPCVMGGLRLALPHAQVPFTAQKALLARLDAASLSVDTMPAFALAAPAAVLDADNQARRAAGSRAALEALDEAWALLARLRSACAAGAAAVDDMDRIAANLEAALAARRAVEVLEVEEA